MSTTTSLALCGGKYFPLTIDATFRKGTGKLLVKGILGKEIRNALLASINAINEIGAYVEGFDSSIFAEQNLYITMAVDDLETIPIAGESYGLALSMAILAAAIHKPTPPDLIYTGCIGPAGEVLPVEGIKEKRRAAKSLGFMRLMLPGSQLDMMSAEIIQCPVHSIAEAFAVTFYEEKR